MLTFTYVYLFVQTRHVCKVVCEVALHFMLNLVVLIIFLSFSLSFYFLLGGSNGKLSFFNLSSYFACFSNTCQMHASHYCRNLNSMTWISFSGKRLNVHSPLDGCRLQVAMVVGANYMLWTKSYFNGLKK